MPRSHLAQDFQTKEAYFDCKAVTWSKHCYPARCAGICSYEGRGGLCSVRLSQPLLKFRPRKDLVETLLHEMIHAYLFVTANNRDHDGHGPQFQYHMNRINSIAKTNITIYHTFHAEVAENKKHWWRCEGTCRNLPPFYGWVKRSMNRAPGPNDLWYDEHQRNCGGTFKKVREPENFQSKQKTKKASTSSTSQPAKRKKAGSDIKSNNNVSDTSIKTLDDYFSGLPGSGHVLTHSTSAKAYSATTNSHTYSTISTKSSGEFVQCPVCNERTLISSMNQHLDVCLHFD
uniref:Protein with SprT-like domain at the N terminus n=1 Tax=Romanomermis culicivorax TaxID=13658 RepID=A0A915JDE3_ROMCU